MITVDISSECFMTSFHLPWLLAIKTTSILPPFYREPRLFKSTGTTLTHIHCNALQLLDKNCQHCQIMFYLMWNSYAFSDGNALKIKYRETEVPSQCP